MTREERIVALIDSGHLSMDAAGRFYRHIDRRSGEAIDPPERADHEGTDGYYRIGGTYAHRAVWVYFNGPIPAGKELNHKDGDKGHNAIRNLELTTRGGNLAHAFQKLGKLRTCGRKGEQNHAAKMTWAKVRGLRALAAKGYSHRRLGAMYGISGVSAGQIVRGETWVE